MAISSGRPGAFRPGAGRPGNSGPGPATRNVAATTTLVLSPAANRPTASTYTVTAHAGLNLAPAASGADSITRPVAGAGALGFQVRALASVGKVKPVVATTALVLSPLARIPANPTVFVAAANRLALAGPATTQQARNVVATTALAFASSAANQIPRTYALAARTGLVARSAAKGTVPASRPVAATDAITFGPSAAGRNTVARVNAADHLSVGPLANVDDDAFHYVHATGRIALAPVGAAARAAIRPVSATTALALVGTGSANGQHNVAATTTLVVRPAARQGRDLKVAATSGLGLGQGEHHNPLYGEHVTSTANLATLATAKRAGLGGAAAVGIADLARGAVALPAGATGPGAVDPGAFGPAATPAGSGLRAILYSGLSGDFPASFAETPSGLVLVANGVDPMLRWDGLAPAADTAGVRPPRSAVMFGGVGAGTIIGERVCYQRFIDKYGNPSILSPVSNTVEFGTDGLIDSVAVAPGGTITLTSPAHGLLAGEPVVISNVAGMGQINGTWTVGTVTADTFTLLGITAAAATATGGGSWTLGVGTVVYSNVEAPAEGKVVRRQLLRNLAGNAEVFYVDIDTTDLASATFTSTLDDETLSAREPVALLFDDDLPQANRHYPPPANKAVVAAHMGRIFATADVTPSRGVVVPTFGSTAVRGLGTDFRPSFAGRVLYIAGASQPYPIAGVDPANQVLTLAVPMADALPAFSTYAIRSDAGTRKFVYYSEPNRPESWPPWNAIAVPEDGDDITGLMVKDSFLYVLETRHIYKYTLQSDPATDGFLFLAGQRGAINNRVAVQVEGSAYLLDDVGIYRFDGGNLEAVSTPIQPLFQQGVGLGGVEVNWAADRTLWHACADPVRETIRWFVAMSGMKEPRHAICYDYRRGRWWVEEYPGPMTSSAVATIAYRRSIAGTDGGRVLCLAEGTLDAVDPAVGGLASVTGAGPLTLLDAAASFGPGLAGATVSIARGSGSGQRRRIVANTATALHLDRPWRVIPDASSSYQLGGVHWRWESGWFRYVADERENPRDVEVVFQPVVAAASMDCELIYDHAVAPRLWAYTADDDGVSTLNGSSRITIDLTRPTGRATQRMAGHRGAYVEADEFVAARLSGVQGPEPARIYSVTLNGAR